MTGGAEKQLANQGVFKGHNGLRGLAEAHGFWEEQPYGTRLYYGPGGGEYLHRSVLEAAVKALDEAADVQAELTALRQRHEKLREQYDDLIYQVATKHPDESRHATAKRYIVERETFKNNEPASALAADEGEVEPRTDRAE